MIKEFLYPYVGPPPACDICGAEMTVWRPEESMGCSFECVPSRCRDRLKARLDAAEKLAAIFENPPNPHSNIGELLYFDDVQPLLDAWKQAKG